MTISKDDIFIVSPGRSVLTAKRGMAHAGGKITLADISGDNPAEIMAGYVATGKVEVDKEAFEAKKAAAAKKAADLKEAAAAGKKRAAEAKAKADAEAKAKADAEAKK